MGFNVEPLTFCLPFMLRLMAAVLLVLAVVAIKPKRKLHENNEICYCLFYSVFRNVCCITWLVILLNWWWRCCQVCLLFYIVLHILFIGYHNSAGFSYLLYVPCHNDQHKKIAKITFPIIWLYVAVTGVIVYLMIAPCVV
jgi:putative membrane protein